VAAACLLVTLAVRPADALSVGEIRSRAQQIGGASNSSVRWCWHSSISAMMRRVPVAT
jgi:hypothetical protein